MHRQGSLAQAEIKAMNNYTERGAGTGVVCPTCGVRSVNGPKDERIAVEAAMWKEAFRILAEQEYSLSADDLLANLLASETFVGGGESAPSEPKLIELHKAWKGG